MTDVLSTTTVIGHTLLAAAQRAKTEIDAYYRSKMEAEIASYPKFVGTDLPLLRRFSPRRELTRDEIIERIDNLDYPNYVAAKMWRESSINRLEKIIQVAKLAKGNLVEVTGEDVALIGIEHFA